LKDERMTSDLDEITGKVKQFYEAHPYPGLDEKLMLKGAKRLSRYFDRPGKILYPGCGTGHGVVSMAKIRPDLEAFGVDLSEPSLELAALLANEQTFDIWDAKNLLESADLEVVDMLSLGRVNIEDLPESWIPFFNKLDNWNKRRVMELYYPQTGSLGIVARKRS
jgi:SAM-dependent methyltransferase